ncbi:hypothetical protein, partial [Longibacter sp.]|uniref:hypothetical protein n=1 Tax=Longibacter sp. TaxID=2045415 RepID=UPI003EBA999F
GQFVGGAGPGDAGTGDQDRSCHREEEAYESSVGIDTQTDANGRMFVARPTIPVSRVDFPKSRTVLVPGDTFPPAHRF